SVFIIIFLVSVSLLPNSVLKRSIQASHSYTLFHKLSLPVSIPKKNPLSKSIKKITEKFPMQDFKEVEGKIKTQVAETIDKINKQLK
ncbi:MAG: hypothetical protein JW795_03455, partial [Chitinivibrionales bacterium]|nr:hypothetical protein [Chitinivibrionales bacterium]